MEFHFDDNRGAISATSASGEMLVEELWMKVDISHLSSDARRILSIEIQRLSCKHV